MSRFNKFMDKYGPELMVLGILILVWLIITG